MQEFALFTPVFWNQCCPVSTYYRGAVGSKSKFTLPTIHELQPAEQDPKLVDAERAKTAKAKCT
jgi:hypothetical protein